STRVSSRPPAWEMIPVPSADTMILGWRAVRYTRKVPFELVRTGLSPSPILPGQRHFSCLNDQAGTAARRKPEVRSADGGRVYGWLDGWPVERSVRQFRMMLWC